MIPKLLVMRFKNVWPTLMVSNRTTYVKNVFMKEGGMLILDILKVSNDSIINGFILTVDFE